jgi:hypothetical protein
VSGATGATGISGATGPAGQDGIDGLGRDGVAGPSGPSGPSGAKPSGVIWVPAAGIQPANVNGAAQNINLEATNTQRYYTLDFDTTTQEFGHFVIAMPSDWDGGTITATFWWTATGISTNSVVWALEGRSYGDSETIDQAYGTAQQIADAHTATARQAQVSGSTPAITLGGTPAASEMVLFRVKRVPADGSDTLAVDALLIGVVITFTRT